MPERAPTAGRLEARVPPPFVMVAVGALMWWAASLTPALRVPVPARVPLAAAVVVAGILVEAAGAVSFVRARTTVDPLHPSAASKLVTGDVYRVTRNPMYLGDLLILVGWAVYLANVPALVLVPLFVAYIDRFQISAEERAMEACFGEAYRAYKGRVRRWL